MAILLSFFFFFFSSCFAFSLPFTIFTGPYFFLCSCASCWHLLVIKVIKVTLGSLDLIKISASRPLAGAEIGIGKSFVIVIASKDSQTQAWVAGADALAYIFSLMTVEHGGRGLRADERFN